MLRTTDASLKTRRIKGPRFQKWERNTAGIVRADYYTLQDSVAKTGTETVFSSLKIPVKSRCSGLQYILFVV